MKNRNDAAQRHSNGRRTFFGLGLAVALMAGLCGTTAFTAAHAQATSGSIFGQAPAGREVVVKSSNGMTRQTTVKSSGHYRIGALPVGVYDAVLLEGGAEVDMQGNIRLTVGGSAKVDFVCAPEGCKASAKNSDDHSP